MTFAKLAAAVLAAALSLCAGRRAGAVSEPHGHAGRADHRRHRHRHPGAALRRPALEAVRAADRGGQPRRCRRHDRRAVGRDGGAGRLYPDLRQFGPRHPRRDQQEPDVRSGRRLRRRVTGRRGARRRSGGPGARRRQSAGIRRACEGEARHHQLRLGWHRHVHAPGRRLLRAEDQYRPRPRALHGQLDHHRRPARRAHPGFVRADGIRASAPGGRSAQGAGGRRQRADHKSRPDTDRAVAGHRLRIRHLVRHDGARQDAEADPRHA